MTRTFTIPYRPSASSHCTGAQAGEWFKNGQGCFNGLAHTIGFTLTGLKTKRQIQNPPLSKTHTFSLSPDGEELRFTSAKGSVGIFQRVAKPKAP